MTRFGIRLMSGSIILIFLILANPASVRAQVLKLSYGINAVDVDGDGMPDIIVRAYLDNGNNNSADFYQVMVRRPLHTRHAYEREWNLVPLFAAEKRYEAFSAQVGNCIWNDLRFVREKGPRGRARIYLYLFYSDESAEGEHDVSIERYRLEEKTSGRTPGDPVMAFVLDRQQAVRSKQCGVEGADQLLRQFEAKRKE